MPGDDRNRAVSVRAARSCRRPGCAAARRQSATAPQIRSVDTRSFGNGPLTLVAGFDQWRHAPHVWDQDGKGYAKRRASDFAESAIGSTTTYTLARLSHEDPSFTRCQCSGWRRRLRHAVTAPFIARRRDGSETFSLATTTGMVAEHVIPAMTWYPTHRGARNGLLHAATSISAKIGIDTFREFVRFD